MGCTQNLGLSLGMVAQIYDLSTQEAKMGRFQASLGYTVKLYFKKRCE